MREFTSEEIEYWSMLIRTDGSSAVKHLVASLVKKGWFIGEGTDGVDFTCAEMQNVAMEKLRLVGINFGGANLNYADLSESNLKHSKFRYSKLIGTNLKGATLTCADLRGADMSNANLTRTILLDADLAGTELRDAWFSSRTIMPDGSLWGQGINLEHFTDSFHPYFWRSTNPFSPAYSDNNSTLSNE